MTKHKPKTHDEEPEPAKVALQAPDLALTKVQPYCPSCGSAVPFEQEPDGDIFGLWVVKCGNCDWMGHSRKFMRQTPWDGHD